MSKRLKVSEMLHEICDNVYFQPPPSKQLTYPCIIYKRSRINQVHADDDMYQIREQYSVTVIDSDPDSTLPEQVAMLKMCSMSQSFISDNLYHSVFTLYI